MFKLHLVAAFICITAISAFAQDENDSPIKKGNWLVGGNLRMTIDDFDVKLSNFTISPTTGYFVGKKLAIGLEQSFEYSDGSNSQWHKSYSVLPFARYYFTQKKLVPFVEIAGGVWWYQGKYYNPITSKEYKASNTISSYKIAAGVNYFISKNVALEGNVQYFLGDGHGPINLNVGLQVFIGRKK